MDDWNWVMGGALVLVILAFICVVSLVLITTLHAIGHCI